MTRKKSNKSHARFMSPCLKAFVNSGKTLRKKSVLQSQLTRLDLVNREEFDVQTQVLLRTREKLALLEQRLAELESKLSAAPAAKQEDE